MRATGRWSLLTLALAAFLVAGCNNSPTGVQSSGALEIVVNPEGASPAWRLEGHDRVETGRGGHRFSDLLPGLYTVTWLPSDQWVNVGEASVTAEVWAGQTATVTGTFVADGPVHVVIDITPAGLDAAWSLTGPDGSQEFGTGAAERDLPHAGMVQLRWEEEPGRWQPQPPLQRYVAAGGETITFAGDYQERFPLQGDFVCVPSGSFTMGSPPDELGHQGDELLHPVTLDHRFWISRQEVTEQQFLDLALAMAAQGAAGVTADAKVKILPGHAEGERDTLTFADYPGLVVHLVYQDLDTDRADPQVYHIAVTDSLDGPAVERWSYHPSDIFIDRLYQPGDPLFIFDSNLPQSMDWYTAATYCDWLNLQEGYPRSYDHATWVSSTDPYALTGYRLPTEAEWEYAARAGTTTAFYTGPITSQMVGDENLEQAAWYGSQATLRPPMGKLPNSFGLYDMLGNLWEWTDDWYAPYPEGPVTDPVGPAEGEGKVTRGGYYASYAVDCRAANRRPFVPGAEDGIGVRPVRTYVPGR